MLMPMLDGPSNDWLMSSNGLTQTPVMAMQYNVMHQSNSAMHTVHCRVAFLQSTICQHTDEWIWSRRRICLSGQAPARQYLPPLHRHKGSLASPKRMNFRRIAKRPLTPYPPIWRTKNTDFLQCLRSLKKCQNGLENTNKGLVFISHQKSQIIWFEVTQWGRARQRFRFRFRFQNIARVRNCPDITILNSLLVF